MENRKFLTKSKEDKSMVRMNSKTIQATNNMYREEVNIIETRDREILEMLVRKAKRLSGDRKTQVGAGVFIDNELFFGTNYLAVNLPEEDIEQRTSLFYDCITHAEIDLCHRCDLTSRTVYVTLFPCDNCAKALIANGVKEIIVLEDRPTASYIIRAKELLDKHGIPYKVIRL